MPDMIRDGKGKGYLAQITSDNKLRTYATTEDEISFESEINAQAYVLMAECTPGNFRFVPGIHYDCNIGHWNPFAICI